ncbi:hypothetical protein C7M84_022044 [Penaeus vannamei]|uniref:Uncharacterized protein n=1 Tax=Penaeus vannamei TaxID=6689 RepID=A0A3R7QZH4_PENVA|nr:hypothetical protein C7M84_022044 [Penaeus vannamei]
MGETETGSAEGATTSVGFLQRGTQKYTSEEYHAAFRVIWEVSESSSSEEDPHLSQILFRWSVEGEAGGALFSAPDGSHAFGISVEDGMPTRRTKTFSRINLAWRTEANRQSSKTIFLPAGARQLEAHYVLQDARDSPLPEAGAELNKHSMFPQPSNDRRLSRIRLRWSVEGEAGGFMFSAPDGSHAFGISVEDGMPTRRTKGLSRINIAWRTEANRQSSKTIFLPAGATQPEAHYVYQDSRDSLLPLLPADEAAKPARELTFGQDARRVTPAPPVTRSHALLPSQGQQQLPRHKVTPKLSVTKGHKPAPPSQMVTQLLRHRGQHKSSSSHSRSTVKMQLLRHSFDKSQVTPSFCRHKVTNLAPRHEKVTAASPLHKGHNAKPSVTIWSRQLLRHKVHTSSSVTRSTTSCLRSQGHNQLLRHKVRSFSVTKVTSSSSATRSCQLLLSVIKVNTKLLRHTGTPAPPSQGHTSSSVTRSHQLLRHKVSHQLPPSQGHTKLPSVTRSRSCSSVTSQHSSSVTKVTPAPPSQGHTQLRPSPPEVTTKLLLTKVTPGFSRHKVTPAPPSHRSQPAPPSQGHTQASSVTRSHQLPRHKVTTQPASVTRSHQLLPVTRSRQFSVTRSHQAPSVTRSHHPSSSVTRSQTSSSVTKVHSAPPSQGHAQPSSPSQGHNAAPPSQGHSQLHPSQGSQQLLRQQNGHNSSSVTRSRQLLPFSKVTPSSRVTSHASLASVKRSHAAPSAHIGHDQLLRHKGSHRSSCPYKVTPSSSVTQVTPQASLQSTRSRPAPTRHKGHASSSVTRSHQLLRRHKLIRSQGRQLLRHNWVTAPPSQGHTSSYRHKVTALRQRSRQLLVTRFRHKVTRSSSVTRSHQLLRHKVTPAPPSQGHTSSSVTRSHSKLLRQQVTPALRQKAQQPPSQGHASLLRHKVTPALPSQGHAASSVTRSRATSPKGHISSSVTRSHSSLTGHASSSVTKVTPAPPSQGHQLAPSQGSHQLLRHKVTQLSVTRSPSSPSRKVTPAPPSQGQRQLLRHKVTPAPPSKVTPAPPSHPRQLLPSHQAGHASPSRQRYTQLPRHKVTPSSSVRSHRSPVHGFLRHKVTPATKVPITPAPNKVPPSQGHDSFSAQGHTTPPSQGHTTHHLFIY